MNTTYAEEVMRLHPLRYYPLNDAVGSGTAKDVSGNGKDATLTGTGVTFGKPPLLKASTLSSVGFTKLSGILTASASGMPTGAQPFSLLGWASPQGAASYQTILGFGAATNNQGAFLYIHPSGHIFASMYIAAAIDSGIATSIGTPYCMVGTYDGTTLRLYVNGVAAGTATTTAALGSVGAWVGNDPSGDPAYSNIAHCAIWNYVLTPDQIAWLYKVGMGAGILQGNHRSFGRVR